MDVSIQSGQYAALSNGIRLHYASAGTRGRPLLMFVHGFPEFWYEWQAQLEEFGADHFAVAPDLRGFNLSDMPHDVAAYKARHIVEDLRLLAAELGYQRFTMIAHDWGGAVAWNFAIALPRLLHRLVILNAPHPYLFMRALAHDPAQREASAYMNWLRADGAEQALAKDGFKALEGLLTGMGRVPAPWFAGELRDRYHECWSRGLHGGLNYYRASPLHPPAEGQEAPPKLELDPEDFRVRVPTRVIWGESDIALPKSLLDGLDGLVDDLRVERIPEATHWLVHEQPMRINSLIRGFLAD